ASVGVISGGCSSSRCRRRSRLRCLRGRLWNCGRRGCLCSNLRSSHFSRLFLLLATGSGDHKCGKKYDNGFPQ
ncbi:MAG: hypothetical protein KKF28_06420, partial [Proteobacteria bacterium]|nr:hypothetical protein [Pseudomonadota bacterium]